MSSKVSIVITCYNKGPYVEESIVSALNQTYSNLEIIIINDGSTDNSSEVIQSVIKKHSNIIFIDNKENKGVVYARNVAIDTATGDYILPLDADDIIEPTYVEKAAKILDDNANVGIVYCQAKLFGVSEGLWGLPEYTLSGILYNNCIFCTALFRKSDFMKAGKYKQNAENSFEDWDLWLSILELGLIPYKINEVLFSYRQCEEATRTQYSNSDLQQARKILLENHVNLYINHPEFVKNVFESGSLRSQYQQLVIDADGMRKYNNDLQNQCQQLVTNVDQLRKNNDKLLKKRKKYKRMATYSIILNVFEILIIAFLVWMLWRA